MFARIVRTVTIAVLALCSSSVWGQYDQPRKGGSSQPRGNPAARSSGKEQFRFSEENDSPAAAPAERTAPRRAGEIRPVADQTPIRQPGSGQGNRPAANGPIGNDPTAIIPCPWEPLAAGQQRALDDLMKAWEQHSSKIERFRCEFKRWEYDPTFGPKDPKKPKTSGAGKLLYAAPDKGLFQVLSLDVYAPPAKEGEQERWLPRPADEIGEHWVCDGKQVFEFDARQKKLIARELPPEMHGKAIVDGPLPFLFGAKADKIKSRYWLRIITPENVQGEHWIEAVPKYASDARKYKMVQVSIDEKDFLPNALQVFDPLFDPEKRPIRTVYTFEKRQYNWDITLQSIRFWEREFYEPKTPFGWTKIAEPFFPEPSQQRPAEKQPTATKPNPLKLPFRLR